MTRFILLGAGSAAALAAFAHAASAQSILSGGGSTSSQFDYGNGAPTPTPGTTEFSIFNGSSPAPAATFSTYWESGGGTGQQGFIRNDLTCLISRATTGTTSCSGNVGGVNTVHYSTSDSVLSSAQVSSWATSSVGQSVAGDLIQLPSMGTGEAIPVNALKLKKNYQLVLDDNDLCGIFSGKLTNFNQLSDFTKSKITAGNFNVVYRTDSAGATFILTEHLSDPNVCNTSNTAAGITFVATTSFATLFPGSKPPSNFYGANLADGVASFLEGTSTYGAQPQAIGYITPDYTSVINKSSPLLVPSITSGKVKAGQPTVKDIILGLENPVDGTVLTPPSTQAQAVNPLAWVPVIQTVSKGYPIVGYTTIDLPQCYADPNVQAAMISFLTDHYTSPTYAAVQNSYGLVTIAKSGASKFLQAIEANILSNTTKFNANIGNITVCAGVSGR
jgi:ABC-type phosphate transport system substrate-binding protein